MENYLNKNFMIFNISELSNINFTQVLETSSDTIRTSVNGLKTFVKWEGDTPLCVNSLTTKEGPYTYEEMSTILSSSDWIDIQIPIIT
jgi:hypothetical protein